MAHVYDRKAPKQAAKRELWVRENSDAIADYDDFVEEHGVMSDGARSF